MSACPLNGVIFVFYLIQFLAFGIGALIVGLLGSNEFYFNLQGSFAYDAGVEKVALANMLASYTALFTLVTVKIFGKFVPQKKRMGSDLNSGEKIRSIIHRHKSLFEKILLLGFLSHFSVTVLQWVNIYFGLVQEINYVVQVLAKIALSVFFLAGLLLSELDRNKKYVFFYLAVYILLQLATGGRGPALYAILLLTLGILFTDPRWFFRKRVFLVCCASLIVVPWLAIQSENVRLLAGSRIPQSFSDLIDRIAVVVTASKQPSLDSWGMPLESSLANSLVRFGARMVEGSVVDVFAKTPELIPYSGWSDEDYSDIYDTFFPSIITGHESGRMPGGVMVLKEYGWAVNPQQGTSFPLTVLGDSWRRGGWFGVILTNIFLVSTLLGFGFFVRCFTSKVFQIVISGPLICALSFSYTNDIVGLIGTFPRLILLSVVYASALIFSSSWNSTRRLGKV